MGREEGAVFLDVIVGETSGTQSKPDLEKIFAYEPACRYVYCVHAWCSQRPEEGVKSLGTVVTGTYKLPYGY